MQFTFPILKIIKVLDGDSLRLSVDLGFKLSRIIDVRIHGIDTPEIRGYQKSAGQLVRQALIKMLTKAQEKGQLTLISEDLDKYGRCLGDIETQDNDSILNFLLEKELGRIYNGGKRGKWEKEELNQVTLHAQEYLREEL